VIRGPHPVRAPRVLLAAALLALACRVAVAQSSDDGAVSLTVQEAMARAMGNQPAIQQAQASLQAAQARVAEAKSAYYPALSASASYVRVEPEQSFTFPELGTFTLAPVDNFDFHLGLNQLIAQFGKRRVQVQMAESGAAAAGIGLEQTKSGVAYQAVQVFYTALFFQQQSSALDTLYKNLEEHLQVIRVREQTGSATELEVLGTQVHMASLRSQQADVENQLRKQLIALRQLTGLPSSTQITLTGGFEPPSSVPDVQEAVASALQKRVEVRQADEAQTAAALGERLAYGSAYPTLSAYGAIGYRNGLLPNESAFTLNWSAGVQLSVPVFQGFLLARSQEEARDKLAAAKASAEAARQNVTTQVLQALEDLQSAREQLAISGSALEQARQMVEVSKLQYDVGVITNLEYLDAQNSLETANITNLSALYKAVLSEYALRQASGDTLAEEAARAGAP
jgi:outer membrane protein